MNMPQDKLTSEQLILKKEHAELLKKIYMFIKENKDLNHGTNTKKVDSFNLLVKEYSKSISKKSTVDRNQREWNRDDKTVERFKKYRKRVSSNSIFQLNEFYNYLLSLKGDNYLPSKGFPKEIHPLGSETLVAFLRNKSATISTPTNIPEDKT